MRRGVGTAGAGYVRAVTDADAEARAAVAAFLSAQHVLSLATVDEAGAPHAASLLYAVEGLTLYWTSKPTVRHSRHLERQPRVAATIAPDTADYAVIRGVQLVGTAVRLTGAPAEAAWACLRARYAYLAAAAAEPAVAAAMAAAAVYRLAPTEVTWIDNRHGFARRHVLRLVPPP